MVMLHGDDKGLVLPPRVAKIQAILIPVGLTAKTTPEQRAGHLNQINELKATLKKAGIRTDIDSREG